jgi:hypothetical protein
MRCASGDLSHKTNLLWPMKDDQLSENILSHKVSLICWTFGYLTIFLICGLWCKDLGSYSSKFSRNLEAHP